MSGTNRCARSARGLPLTRLALTMVAVLGFAHGHVACAAAPERALPQLRCGADRPREMVWLGDVDRMFALRAVEILKAAIVQDRPFLATAVSPLATFVLWRGDAGSGRQAGIDGALAFAQRLRATRSTYFLSFAGPISTDPCGVQVVELLFSSEDGRQAYQIRFRFDGGLLVVAEGREGEVMRGALTDSVIPPALDGGR